MGRGRRPLGKARSLAHTSVITVREGASDPATTRSFARRPRVDVNGGASGRAPRQRWERSALRRLSELVDDLLRLVRHVNETGPLPGKSQAFATDTRGGQLAHLEALHRERAGDFSGGRVPGLPTSFRPGRAGRGRGLGQHATAAARAATTDPLTGVRPSMLLGVFILRDDDSCRSGVG